MSTGRSITIIGGGLAGLALGIGLRQRNLSVTILEAGAYPRHRVCGEFISGKGEETLVHLGLLPVLKGAGAIEAGTASFATEQIQYEPRRLPSPALCISRYRMDKALADEFERLGGKLKVGTRWQGDFTTAGIVGATGRQRANPECRETSWFGMKAHFYDVPMKADLEVHVNSRGYVGLCRLEGGAVNACGLFKSDTRDRKLPSEKLDRFLELAGTKLGKRLRDGRVSTGSFCSIAGLRYNSPGAFSRRNCVIGDCLTLIPPFTGNGMSMALEAAELAIDPLSQYCLGQLDWREAQGAVRQSCRRRFARRLVWARMFHQLMFLPAAQRALGFLIFGFDRIWRQAFLATR